jgi:putative FmdB family regulatory protein
MPIYEYRCKRGHTFEVMRRISDDPLSKCEQCSAPVERVFRPVAVHFKGSGFYNTDYGTRKRSREKESAEKNASSDSKSDSGGSKSDSAGAKSDSGGSNSDSGGSNSDSGASKSDSGGSKSDAKSSKTEAA